MIINIGKRLSVDSHHVEAWSWTDVDTDHPTLVIAMASGHTWNVMHDSVHAWCGRVDAFVIESELRGAK